MKFRACILIFVILSLSLVLQAQAGSVSAQEYQVKAAFLYNFIMFVDWPEEKMASGKDPVIIGIIGKDPFGEAFGPITSKQAKGKDVIVKHFKGLAELKKAAPDKMAQEIEEIKKCHVLFICSSEKEKGTVKEIINLLKGSSVLTVSDTDGFLESEGGIINFILHDQKIRFEVDIDTAKQANLKIRSQLLRLAKKVIGSDSATLAKG
ncbi:MAG: YfiR family protein [Sedimentisphaerales bacterium]|nr:YfiR family protein [Sedimentisphaerales bacterium]